MEKKISLLSAFIVLVLTGCDPGVGVSILNDTDDSVEFKILAREFVRTIDPGENFWLSWIGTSSPDSNQKSIEADIKYNYGDDGFDIIYLADTYHLTPDTLAYLMKNSARYKKAGTGVGGDFYLNISKAIEMSEKRAVVSWAALFYPRKWVNKWGERWK